MSKRIKNCNFSRKNAENENHIFSIRNDDFCCCTEDWSICHLAWRSTRPPEHCIRNDRGLDPPGVGEGTTTPRETFGLGLWLNGWTDWDAVCRAGSPRLPQHYIRQGSQSPRGQFSGHAFPRRAHLAKCIWPLVLTCCTTVKLIKPQIRHLGLLRQNAKKKNIFFIL